jgi:hypothetical protein
VGLLVPKEGVRETCEIELAWGREAREAEWFRDDFDDEGPANLRPHHVIEGLEVQLDERSERLAPSLTTSPELPAV